MNSEDLKAMEIHEVYVYYDRPLLFSCKNELDHICMVVLIEEEDDFDEWLYVGVSPHRFQFIRSGGIDLHDAFGLPESESVYIVKIENNNTPLQIQVVPSKQILEEWLPKRGEFLHLETVTLSESLTKKATQVLRDIIRLRLKFHKIFRTEAPARTLGEVLANFQETIDQIGLAHIGKTVPLLVTGFSHGSFEIEFESQEQVNLFGESATSEAIKKIVDLITLSDSPERVMELLKELEMTSKTSQSYLKFLKAIKTDVAETSIEWISPRKNYGGKIAIKEDTVDNLIKTIEREERVTTKTYSIKGKLRAINLDSKFFSMLDAEEQKYSGRISEEALETESVQHAQMNKDYKAIIQETTVHKLATNAPDVTKVLMELQ